MIFAPNYTQVPNFVLDTMHERNASQNLVILAVCRLTFGWQLRDAEISIAALVDATGLSKSTVIRAIESLLATDNPLIYRNAIDPNSPRRGYIYGIIIHENAVDNSTQTGGKLVSKSDKQTDLLVSPRHKGLSHHDTRNTPACFTTTQELVSPRNKRPSDTKERKKSGRRINKSDDLPDLPAPDPELIDALGERGIFAGTANVIALRLQRDGISTETALAHADRWLRETGRPELVAYRLKHNSMTPLTTAEKQADAVRHRFRTRIGANA